MNQVKIEVLDPVKMPLVSRLYKAHYPSGKAKKDELTIVAYQNNTLVGVVRFRSIDKYRLLTGMLVVPECRAQGIGHQLMAYCQQNVLSEGDYCFAYEHLESFYSQYGFEAVEGGELPNPLKVLYERYCNSGKKLVGMRHRD